MQFSSFVYSGMYAVSRVHDDIIINDVIMHSWLYMCTSNGCLPRTSYSYLPLLAGQALSVYHSWLPASLATDAQASEPYVRRCPMLRTVSNLASVFPGTFYVTSLLYSASVLQIMHMWRTWVGTDMIGSHSFDPSSPSPPPPHAHTHTSTGLPTVLLCVR